MEMCTTQMAFLTRVMSSFLVRQTVARNKIKERCLQSFSTTSNKLQELTEQPESSSKAQSPQPPTMRPPLPVMTSRKVDYLHPRMRSRQAWLETLDTIEDEKLGVIDLHPEIFATNPRLDMLHKNIQWQTTYKRISHAKTKSRAEVQGGGKRPWPQKGLGRARHSSIRSPLWVGGGRAMGPRGPKSYFYMLPTAVRVQGLRVALSVKYAQNDLHIVDSLDIPTDDPQYMEDLVDSRYWGYSALFVDDTDYMPRNIAVALSNTPHFNLLPVYGLNVYSMLKHETLVLTVAAVEKLEEKLLYQMYKTEMDTKFHSHRGIKPYKLPLSKR
ncbi:large ribosomal subunit protein uL4m-like [Haliotis cracherodii]|uniref:large ribosomal subunit protein uL4m-like n=1 Tax=Haliotis cracherodii TaxID=6455 RepID=UPI0039EA9AE9